MTDPQATPDRTAIKPLTIIEWDAGEYGIGYAGSNPIFYFGDESLDLAGKLVAAYNENAANHVCKVIVWQSGDATWCCTECGEHHLVR